MKNPTVFVDGEGAQTEIDLVADRTTMRELGQAFAQGSVGVLCDVDSHANVRKLVSRSLQSKVRVTIEEDAVVLSGDTDSRKLFGENMVTFVNLYGDGGSDHIHFEYYPEHFFLDESATPIIFTIQESQ